LTAGKLHALKLTGDPVEWVEIPANQAVKVREAGKAAGARPFHRPEDIEYNSTDGLVYIAETGDDKQVAPADQDGRVRRLDLTRNTMTVFVQGDPSKYGEPEQPGDSPG
jgi:secreted PhoX family phosphatase